MSAKKGRKLPGRPDLRYGPKLRNIVEWARQRRAALDNTRRVYRHNTRPTPEVMTPAAERDEGVNA